MARFFHFSLEIEFSALRFINYTIPRLCSTYVVVTIVFQISVLENYLRYQKNTPTICLILHQFNLHVLLICGEEIGDD